MPEINKEIRLRLLDEKLFNRKQVKLKDQIKSLYEEYKVKYDIKTMQRDIDALKERLLERYDHVGKEILYKENGTYRYLKGYCAFKETNKIDGGKVAKLFKFNKIFNPEVNDKISHYVTSIINDYNEFEEKVIPWHPIGFINKENAGQANFATLLKHINLNEPITFTHRNIKSKSTKQHLIVPIFLKEVDNGFSKAWFMLGQKFNREDREVNLQIKKFNIYNIDRIRDIAIFSRPIRIKYPKQFEPSDYFKNSFLGTYRSNLSDQKFGPEFVKLKILDEETLEQLKRYPLHPSQKIKTRNNENHIELNIEIAFDLQKFIFGHSENIVVIQPKILKEKIKELLIRANKNYGIGG